MSYTQNEIELIRQRAKVLIPNEINPETGLPRDLILSFMTDADLALQGLIMDNCPNQTIFHKQHEFNIIANQRNYDLPADVFATGDIDRVEYTWDGSAKYYKTICPLEPSNFENYPNYRVEGYQIVGNEIWIDPMPQTSQGRIRITYNKQTEKLDVRRGTIASATNDGTYYLTITLADDDILDDAQFANYEYICVNNKHGDEVHYNIEYSSYDSTTRVFTLPAATVLMATGTIVAGQFVTLDKYSTTHSRFPRFCDEYRKLYSVIRILEVNSNVDVQALTGSLDSLEERIVSAFQRRQHTPQGITYVSIDE